MPYKQGDTGSNPASPTTIYAVSSVWALSRYPRFRNEKKIHITDSAAYQLM